MNDRPVTPANMPMGEPPSGQTHLPRRILVVEDDEDICRLNSSVLGQFGCQVDMAADGVAAWEALQRTHYDLLVTDNNMPKMSGVELLRKLHAARMAVPVIMATGVLPEEEFSRSPWIHPAAVLLKPYALAELLRTVREILTGAIPASEASNPSQMDGADGPA